MAYHFKILRAKCWIGVGLVLSPLEGSMHN